MRRARCKKGRLEDSTWLAIGISKAKHGTSILREVPAPVRSEDICKPDGNKGPKHRAVVVDVVVVVVVVVVAAAAVVANCTQTMKGNPKLFRKERDASVPARIPWHDANPLFPRQYSSTDIMCPHLFQRKQVRMKA